MTALLWRIWFPTRAKHNAANGENNNDGTNDNLSWNNGAEGPTSDAGHPGEPGA